MISSIQTHVISITILLVLYFSIKQQSLVIQQKNRYFLVIVLFNIVAMVMKIAMEGIKSYPGSLGDIVFNLSTAIYYVNSVFVVLYWLFYLHYHVKGESVSKRNLLMAYSPYMVMALTAILLSFIGIPAMYSITEDRSIERHLMYGPVVFTEYAIMLGSVVYVIWHKDELSKFEFMTLITYQLPPTVGIILTETFSGFDLIWPSLTVSLLIVYVNIQSRMTNTDPLTGVFNRREYEKQVQYLSGTKKHRSRVSAMMIDIDDFKQINDESSHQMGDIALVDVSQILQKSVRKNDFIARIGGDEFCIIIESDQASTLHDVINRINHHMDIYNQERKGQRIIRLSMGYGIYDSKHHGTFKDFFERLDQRMYEEKNLAKQVKIK